MSKKKSYIILTFAIILFIILYFYTCVIECLLYKQHQAQTNEWITDLTDTLILGINNRELYKKINVDGTNITVWYIYWVFTTKTETFWILANMKNKFSNLLVLHIYCYNHEKDILITDTIDMDVKDIKTSKDHNTLTLQLKNIYVQTINLIDNKSTIRINSNKFKVFLDLSITDSKTNCPSFIPRLKNTLGLFTNINVRHSKSPGEWMSDNPYIGKIVNGYINDTQVNDGNYWFDNFIGCNNAFISTYKWFVINNDNWLIYLFWFESDNNNEKKGIMKPILIKNKKEDKYIYSGFNGLIYDPFNPIKKMEYTSSKKIGVDDYDDYTIIFNSYEIDICIRSNKNTCKKVYDFYYYRDDVADNKYHTFSEWDKEYYKILRNMIFVEYVVFVDVEINYKNKIEKFKDRQVIDSFYKEDEMISRTIKYNSL